MKLKNDIKKQIDNYFDNITSQELYNLAVKSYGFKEKNKKDMIAATNNGKE